MVDLGVFFWTEAGGLVGEAGAETGANEVLTEPGVRSAAAGVEPGV